MNKEERLAYQRNIRKNNENLYTKKYEKTINGYLMRMYRNMKSRVEGVQHLKSHLYQGKELMDKASFYEFAKCSPMFLALFYQYEKEGYPRNLAPTADRIDSSKGYTISNIQWVTQSINSSLGAKSKHEQYSKNSLHS